MYKGQLAGFPQEVVEKMLSYQVAQGNLRNLSIFEEQKDLIRGSGGFDWEKTTEGVDFWDDVISDCKFNVFFKKYPKFDSLPERFVIRQDACQEACDWANKHPKSTFRTVEAANLEGGITYIKVTSSSITLDMYNTENLIELTAAQFKQAYINTGYGAFEIGNIVRLKMYPDSRGRITSIHRPTNTAEVEWKTTGRKKCRLDELEIVKGINEPIEIGDIVARIDGIYKDIPLEVIYITENNNCKIRFLKGGDKGKEGYYQMSDIYLINKLNNKSKPIHHEQTSNYQGKTINVPGTTASVTRGKEPTGCTITGRRSTNKITVGSYSNKTITS